MLGCVPKLILHNRHKNLINLKWNFIQTLKWITALQKIVFFHTIATWVLNRTRDLQEKATAILARCYRNRILSHLKRTISYSSKTKYTVTCIHFLMASLLCPGIFYYHFHFHDSVKIFLILFNIFNIFNQRLLSSCLSEISYKQTYSQAYVCLHCYFSKPVNSRLAWVPIARRQKMTAFSSFASFEVVSFISKRTTYLIS